MRYYDLPDEQREAMGLDYDLDCALEYNPQEGWALEDIARVLAVVEGEKDERDWHWIVRLLDGRFVYATGGCDYTGWDCQSQLSSSFHATVEAALMTAEEVDGDGRDIRGELALQVEGEKATTWREQKDKEFGI